jgi:transketolase
MTDATLLSADGSLDLVRIRGIADAIRRRVLDHVIANDGGYLSQACSSAEILATLYGGPIRLAALPSPLPVADFAGVPGPGGAPSGTGAVFHGATAPHLDRLIVSPAHYALVVYAALIEVGRLEEAALDRFNVDGSTVEMIGAEHSPGFEMTTGSLAQALSTAGGIALARRLRGDTGRTIVMMSDGELQEGQTWEAFAALSHHRLSTVRVVVDVNAQQCDGPMDSVLAIEPIADRIRAFGLEVDEVDGHDVEAIAVALTRDVAAPQVILARTDPAHGVPLLRERAPVLHYLRFGSAEERLRYVAFRDDLASPVGQRHRPEGVH